MAGWWGEVCAPKASITSGMESKTGWWAVPLTAGAAVAVVVIAREECGREELQGGTGYGQMYGGQIYFGGAVLLDGVIQARSSLGVAAYESRRNSFVSAQNGGEGAISTRAQGRGRRAGRGKRRW